eukprot:403346553
MENPPIEFSDIDSLLVIVPVFLCYILLFIVAQIKKDNSIIDTAWGLIFILPNFLVLLLKDHWLEKTLLTFFLVSFWGLRLSIYIFLRRTGKEDFRYAELRERWEAKGKCYYYFATFIFVFMMQAFFSLVVGSSALYISLWSGDQFSILDAIGAFVWLFGFVFELVADRQMKQFREDPSNRGKLIKVGLWRYSRHPNYFGEAVLWWGIYLIACSVEYGWITFFSAGFITFLLRFVSGVPLLEEKYKNRPDFQIYMKETNIFVPWFVRKVSEEERQTIFKGSQQFDVVREDEYCNQNQNTTNLELIKIKPKLSA